MESAVETGHDAGKPATAVSQGRKRISRSTTAAERLEKLREMFRLLPKHKGTEKLQSDLKQKISRLKDEIEGSKAAARKWA